MLYTLGLKDRYDSYIEADPDAAKGVTGSVWKTMEDVQAHFERNKSVLGSFAIYGVEADWETDTEVVPGESWRALTRSGKLVKL